MPRLRRAWLTAAILALAHGSFAHPSEKDADSAAVETHDAALSDEAAGSVGASDAGAITHSDTKSPQKTDPKPEAGADPTAERTPTRRSSRSLAGKLAPVIRPPAKPAPTRTPTPIEAPTPAPPAAPIAAPMPRPVAEPIAVPAPKPAPEAASAPAPGGSTRPAAPDAPAPGPALQPDRKQGVPLPPEAPGTPSARPAPTQGPPVPASQKPVGPEPVAPPAETAVPAPPAEPVHLAAPAAKGSPPDSPATPPASTEAVFEQIGGRWITHYLAGDLEGLMALYTADARVMLHGKPALVGKPAIRQYFANNLPKGDVMFKIDVERAEILGDMAYLISKYWMTVTPPGGDVHRDAGRSLLIYRRSGNGDWLIHADIDQATPDVTWPAPDKAASARAHEDVAEAPATSSANVATNGPAIDPGLELASDSNQSAPVARAFGTRGEVLDHVIYTLSQRVAEDPDSPVPDELIDSTITDTATGLSTADRAWVRANASAALAQYAGIARAFRARGEVPPNMFAPLD